MVGSVPLPADASFVTCKLSPDGARVAGQVHLPSPPWDERFVKPRSLLRLDAGDKPETREVRCWVDEQRAPGEPGPRPRAPSPSPTRPPIRRCACSTPSTSPRSSRSAAHPRGRGLPHGAPRRAVPRGSPTDASRWRIERAGRCASGAGRPASPIAAADASADRAPSPDGKRALISGRGGESTSYDPRRARAPGSETGAIGGQVVLPQPAEDLAFDASGARVAVISSPRVLTVYEVGRSLKQGGAAPRARRGPVPPPTTGARSSSPPGTSAPRRPCSSRSRAARPCRCRRGRRRPRRLLGAASPSRGASTSYRGTDGEPLVLRSMRDGAEPTLTPSPSSTTDGSWAPPRCDARRSARASSGVSGAAGPRRTSACA